MKNIFKSIGALFTAFMRKPLSAIGSILSLSILFFLMFVSLMFMSFSLQASHSAEESIQISFYLKPDTEQYKIAVLRAQLLNMKNDGDIADFSYFSKEDVEKQFANSQPDRFLFLQKNLGKDFSLAPRFQISPKNKDIQSLIYYFLHSDFTDIIDTEKLQNSSQEIVEKRKMLEFLEFVKRGTVGVIATLFVGISLVLASFISSLFYARKDEVFIMRLVGATYSFIRIPFIVEGLVLTCIAVGVGWTVFFVLRTLAIEELLLTLSSREEIILTAQYIQGMWNVFLEMIPFVLGGLMLFIFIVSYLTIEHLLRTKKELL